MKGKTPDYPDFDSLLRKNKSIFNFFGGKGIFRAVWDTRQEEIDGLKKNLEEYSANLAWYKQQILDLKDQILALEREKEKLSGAMGFGHLMDQVQKMFRAKLLKSARDKDELLANLKSLELALIQQERTQESLEEELRCERERYERTSLELERARAHIRTQKRMNAQMGEELLKVSSELSEIQEPQA